MSRFAVLLYSNASLQEITCLTAALSVWYGESIDYIAGEDREYRSEEGLRLLPTKTAAQADPADYDCVILLGTIDPLLALYDEALIVFLRRGIGTNTVFAAISSAPLLLCKAGLLKGKKFTAGFFMQMADVFPFVEKENFHGGVCFESRLALPDAAQGDVCRLEALSAGFRHGAPAGAARRGRERSRALPRRDGDDGKDRRGHPRAGVLGRGDDKSAGDCRAQNA